MIYARDPRNSVKQQKTRALTSNLTDGALLWQVACEFIAGSRKLTAVGYTQAEAWGELEQLCVLWKLIVPSEKDFVRAEQLTATQNLSFRDAMIVAAWHRNRESVLTRASVRDTSADFTHLFGK